MKIIESIEEMHKYSQQLKREGKIIGSVDTAGNLHDGHMFLVKIAKENADIVLLSISHTVSYFRCSPEEYAAQLKIYEQDVLKKEIELCKKHNVDVLFCPSMGELPWPPLNISIPIIDRLIIDRPYFPPINMKYIVGYKELYNIMLPDATVLGQKDAHQTFAVKYFIKQLDLPIKVIIAPIVRDSNGMALSSRNEFLTPSERQDATSIYQTLHEISRWPTYPSIEKIKEHIINRITNANGTVNCIDICCVETLEELNSIDKKSVIIVNVKFGDVDELYDNIIIEP